MSTAMEPSINEDVTHLVKHEPKGAVLSIRLAPAEAKRFIALARKSGKTLSQLGREAMLAYIAGGLEKTKSSNRFSGFADGGLIKALDDSSTRGYSVAITYPKEQLPMNGVDFATAFMGASKIRH